MKIALITGITGQDGCYLSKLLIDKGYTIIGLTRNYSAANTQNLSYLGILDKIIFEECNLLDISEISKLIKKYQPDEIYNLASQSSVKISFDQPMETFTSNTLSVINLLDSIKTIKPDIKFYQASSSEMYGKVDNLPINEKTVIHPLSPYAISKASAHWLTVNYREAFGLFACCGVLFNHESYLRSNDFFVKKVIRESINIKKGIQANLKVGNIDVKRDFGYAPAYVSAMWLIMQQQNPDDFVICSGKSLSLREIIYYIFNKLGISQDKLFVDKKFYRPVDIMDIYGNNSKAKDALGWNYNMNFFEVLDVLIEEEIKNQGNS
jgi:GDPmannose 4,6-dehydratase